MTIAHCEVVVDDARVIATRWTMPPGTETGAHTHAHDYIVVYLTGGALTVATPDGREIEASVTPQLVTSRAAGVSHNVMNRSGATIEFIEIELK